MADDDILTIIENGLILHLRENQVEPGQVPAAVIESYFEHIRDTYGGCRYMLKRGYRRYSEQQIEQIRREYNGKNQAEILRTYGISRSTLYRYLQK